ncbi:MAG TPA: hypothetical protein VIL34_03610 [Actinopolymorphaceae bacterium]|jgi:hypothetical protein
MARQLQDPQPERAAASPEAAESPADFGSETTEVDESGTMVVRFRPALRVRILGMACAWLGIAIVVDVVRRAIPGLDHPFVTAVEWILLAAVGVVVAWGAWIFVGRGTPLVMTRDGFRNRTTWRRESVREATWSEVSNVRRMEAATGPFVVLELRDGRRSLIAAGVLDIKVERLESELRTRLDAAHGYRPLGAD